MKLRVVLIFSLTVLSVSLSNAQNSDWVPRPIVIEYINTYKSIAISEMKRTGVPAAIKLAQGIHETEAGTSMLVRKSNNHFGIKCKTNWTGAKVSHDDDARGECFRSYPESKDSYMDHSNFLKGSPRYASLFQLDPTDYEAWAFGLRKAGYATNIKYANILVKIIREYHLNDYTLIALGKLKPEEEWLAGYGSIIDPANKSVELPIDQPAVIMLEEPIVSYPQTEFRINETRVVYAKKGTSLLSIAEKYDVPYKRILEFNELGKSTEDILMRGQLIYLQRKRKTGLNEYHIVGPTESLYDICQVEGLRIESLLEYNLLNWGMQPAPGEKLYLRSKSSSRPLLASEVKKAQEEEMNASTIKQEAMAVIQARHIVQTKETLYAISKKYNVPVEKLREWNKLDSYALKTGQELIIYKN